MKSIKEEEILLKQLSGELKHKDDWMWLLVNYKIPEDLIIKYKDKFFDNYLDLVTFYQDLSEEFLRNNVGNFNNICWDNICECQNVSEKFLLDYSNKIPHTGWNMLAKTKHLSNELILKIFEILMHSQTKISSFISVLIKNPKNVLSEELLSKCIESHGFTNDLWNYILTNYKLSNEFLLKHKQKIFHWNWDYLLKYQDASEELINYIKEKRLNAVYRRSI